jgi:hypothetical protein
MSIRNICSACRRIGRRDLATALSPPVNLIFSLLARWHLQFLHDLDKALHETF